MWWKLSLVFLVALVLIIATIPVRTHAALFDPDKPPPTATPEQIIASMYLTPGAAIAILTILTVAVLVAYRIVRRG